MGVTSAELPHMINTRFVFIVLLLFVILMLRAIKVTGLFVPHLFSLHLCMLHLITSVLWRPFWPELLMYHLHVSCVELRACTDKIV